MDMNDPNEFKLQTFDEEFQGFFHAWKSNWTPMGNLGNTCGPLFLRGVTKKSVSDERLAAHKPEEDAYNRLVEYSAISLAIAYREGGYELMIDRINQQYHLGDVKSKQDYPRFISDVMKRTFSMLSQAKEDPSKIDALIKEQRSKFHKDLKFGSE